MKTPIIASMLALFVAGCSGPSYRKIEGSDLQHRVARQRESIPFVPPPRVSSTRSTVTPPIYFAPPLTGEVIEPDTLITRRDMSARFDPPVIEPEIVEPRFVRHPRSHRVWYPPVPVVYPPYYRGRYAPHYRHYRHGYPLPHTVVFGTLGGIIGHQSGHRDEGILIGAGIGLLHDIFQP
ncbi:MAG: hypothetical protein KDC38_07795 [Planctomycetes bacterium]|nr:hypothetical protein [Planctomycetota bacterium]